MKLSSQEKENYSILDIKGVDKEIWKGVEAQNYVNDERAIWD